MSSPSFERCHCHCFYHFSFLVLSLLHEFIRKGKIVKILKFTIIAKLFGVKAPLSSLVRHTKKKHADYNNII